MNDRIYLSSPGVTQREEDALVRAIRSGWVAPTGPEVDAFEAELAEYCGRTHAVALCSGTSALHLGLLALGVGPGDVVVTSDLTFIATANANAIVYTGAEPVFVDADETGNINPGLLSDAIGSLVREGRTVKAVVPADLLGKVVDHERIEAIAYEHGVPVLAAAAESVGATRNGRSSAGFGVAAAVSFNGNKVMTTSGGGALLTDDAEMARQARYLLTTVLVNPEVAGFTADDLRLALADQNIEARPMWKPMHLQPVYSTARAFVDGTGERLFRTGLSLPSGSVLDPARVTKVTETITSFLEAARGR